MSQLPNIFRTCLLALSLALMASSASAQCSGQPTAGLVCGNPNASTGFPLFTTQTKLLDRGFSSTQGTVLNRGASTWSATPSPSLGLNGGTGGSLTFNGSTSGSATISVAAAAGSVTFRLPITNGTVNQVLITDGSGNLSYGTAGSGTVSSVGLSLPGIFSVSGSPVTGAGTLTATLATQSANLVWAGPTTGAAATPTFRSLVGADLPNPGASSLGGIQSFAAVSSQWINQISTSGVPTASQPAFTDISGALAAAQCPNPGASSLGCTQSFAAVTSQWIRQISTAGVVTASQPAFGDISGTLASGQLPTFGNNTIVSNISGGTSVPIGNTLTALIDTIGATQGQVLYRNGSIWTILAPGTAGFVLTTGGPAANPTWTNPAGGGTVTSIASGTGIAVGGSPCTTVCTINLGTIADHTVLANISGGSLAPSSTTVTALLDNALGSTQGNLLYRNATVWTVLAPGTSNQALTQSGSSPAWASIVNTFAGNTGAFTVSNGITNSTNDIRIDVSYVQRYIAGLTLSNDGVSPNTVIDVAAGVAASDDNTTLMKLSSAFTKNMNSTWVVGSTNGCADGASSYTALAATTWYHIFEIERTDTQVVDILCSKSATAPTLPASYTKQRRLGSVRTDGSSHILAFTQSGNTFLWSVPFVDYSFAAIGTAAANYTLTVPTNVQVQAKISAIGLYGSSSTLIYVSSLSVADSAPATYFNMFVTSSTTGMGISDLVLTNSSGQIRGRASTNTATINIMTQGWVDSL